MFKLTMDGKPLSAKEFGEKVRQQAITAGLDRVRQQIEGIECPQCGGRAKGFGVKRDGDAYQLKFDACHPELEAAIDASLQ